MTNSIVISGGSRGIGYAIAELFAKEGWTIFVGARMIDGLKKMEDTWKKKYPKSQLYTVAADLSTEEGCRVFASYIKKQTNQLHILVNNLGQFSEGTLLGGPTDQLSHFLKTNVLSAHYLTRALNSLLLEIIASQVFTIGSVAANNWPPFMTAYALSKETLHAWHRGIRMELAEKGIDATLIVPGATYTSSWDGIDIDPNDLLKPEAVAQLVWDNWISEDKQQEVLIELK